MPDTGRQSSEDSWIVDEADGRRGVDVVYTADGKVMEVSSGQVEGPGVIHASLFEEHAPQEHTAQIDQATYKDGLDVDLDKDMDVRQYNGMVVTEEAFLNIRDPNRERDMDPGYLQSLSQE